MYDAFTPEAWRQVVTRAASVAEAEQLLALIAEIPPEQAGVARALTEMVHNFGFEEIMQLTAPS